VRNQSRKYRHALGVPLLLLLVALAALSQRDLPAAQPGAQAAQSTEASRMQQGFPPSNPQMSKEEKLQEIKHDTDALAELVTSLKSDLGKADPNTLEKKELAKRADKIEKLARKIKDSFKGY
jgi:uncharacterized membrane protein YdfJ with MMPL/SSD domain